MHHILRGIYSDQEIDSIYKTLEDTGETGHPPFLVAQNPAIISKAGQSLYDKVAGRIADINRLALKGWG